MGFLKVIMALVIGFGFVAFSYGRQDRTTEEPKRIVQDPHASYLQEVSPGVFVLPPGRFLTGADQRKLNAIGKTVMLHSGPPGTPGYVVGITWRPYRVDPFVVQVLPDAAVQIDKALGDEVRRQLLKAKPENPGRDQSFWKWETTRWDPARKERVKVPLIRTGWTLAVKRAERTSTGWRAVVYVYPQARSEDYETLFVFSLRHIEVYEFKDGKLALVNEAVDPTTDPTEGFHGRLR